MNLSSMSTDMAESSDTLVAIELERAKLLAEADKSLSSSSSSIKASESTEGHLWMGERPLLLDAIKHLASAEKGFQKFIDFMKANGRNHMILDGNGEFYRNGDIKETSDHIQAEIRKAESREKADLHLIDLEDQLKKLSLMASKWIPSDPDLEGSFYLSEIRGCRELFAASLAAYERMGSESRCKNIERSGRTVGLQMLKVQALDHLNRLEEQAKHRLAGDEYLVLLDAALEGTCDQMQHRNACCKIFSSVDTNGCGRIGPNSLREALTQLNIYLSGQQILALLENVGFSEGESIDFETWERKIVLESYGDQLNFFIASNCWDDASKEYQVADAPDRHSCLLKAKQRIEHKIRIGKRECLLGALWGVFVGDSLGLPSDGSVNLRACQRDYRTIGDMVGPFGGTHADGGMHLALHSHLEHIGAEPTIFHPFSIREPNRKSDIMGGKDALHGLPGVHPHMGLSEGCSTLTGQISQLLLRSIAERRGFDRDHFLEQYLQYMLEQPDKDSQIEPYHIEYFERLARGNKPYYSAGIGKAASEATSSILVQIVPLVVYLLPQSTYPLIADFAALDLKAAFVPDTVLTASFRSGLMVAELNPNQALKRTEERR